jgi:hypothetical protein
LKEILNESMQLSVVTTPRPNSKTPSAIEPAKTPETPMANAAKFSDEPLVLEKNLLPFALLSSNNRSNSMTQPSMNS